MALSSSLPLPLCLIQIPRLLLLFKTDAKSLESCASWPVYQALQCTTTRGATRAAGAFLYFDHLQFDLCRAVTEKSLRMCTSTLSNVLQSCLNCRPLCASFLSRKRFDKRAISQQQRFLLKLRLNHPLGFEKAVSGV